MQTPSRLSPSPAEAACHRPVFRTACSGSVLQVLVSLLVLCATISGCKDKTQKRDPKAPMAWEGLSLGMPVKEAKERIQSLGWSVTCQPAPSVMYLADGVLTTHWVMAKEKSRTERCDAQMPRAKDKQDKQASPQSGTDKERSLLHAKLFFLDGVLRQINVVLAKSDSELSSLLTTRWGEPQHTEVAVQLYSGGRRGKIRLSKFEGATTSVLWLRRANLHELIFLETPAEAVSQIQKISSPDKDS